MRWLVNPGHGATRDIQVALIGGLFGTLPVFFGGVINTIVVSGAIAAREQTLPFIAWFVFEIVLGAVRLIVLSVSRRAALAHRQTPTSYLLLLFWSSGVARRPPQPATATGCCRSLVLGRHGRRRMFRALARTSRGAMIL
jgi:hypothetical protein